MTVAEHLRARVAQWETSGKRKISAKTAERCWELIKNQIVPHLGTKPLQKLQASDIESWHTTLLIGGRKGGNGGVSARTAKRAYHVLPKALKDAVRHNLIAKNAASDEGEPQVEDEEIIILTNDRIKEPTLKLAGHRIYCRAILPLFTGGPPRRIAALRWPPMAGHNRRGLSQEIVPNSLTVSIWAKLRCRLCATLMQAS